jgi:dTDP-4-amino-4,6-dideoxygalactose transaminase
MKVGAQRYTVPPEDIDYILTKFRGLLEARDFLTLGQYGEEFEQDFARYHGASFGVATNSGTGAIEIILRAIGVEGREVIVPTNTFAATAFAVIRAGGRPVFADILPDLTLDPADAARRITERTAAIITVHLGGLVSPATVDLCYQCDLHNIPLIEDAAHAHGSSLDGKAAGTFGVASAFSFFSTKVMTTGEGGMILTNHERIYRDAQVLRDQAKVQGGNYHETVGYNWRMPEIQAIMGLTQLRRLDEFIQRRQQIAAIYDQALGEVPGLELLPISPRCNPNYYKYIALLRYGGREELAARLRRNHQVSLGGSVYELPLHRQPAFQLYFQEPLSVAEDLCARHICPPIYPEMTDEQAEFVAEVIRAEIEEMAGDARPAPR